MTAMLMVSMGSCSKDEPDEPYINPDPASVIAGTYIGTGVTTVTGLPGLGDQSYPGMKIVLIKSSNEYVVLKVYNADGTSFFKSDTGHVYQISQLTSGDYKLTNDEYPLAQLTVTKSGKLKYNFPYVNGGDYTLTIEATREY